MHTSKYNNPKDAHPSKNHTRNPPHHVHHSPSPHSSLISRPSTHSRALSGDSTSPSVYSTDEDDTETSDASGLGAHSAPPFSTTFSVTRRPNTLVHPIQDRGVHKSAARRVGTMSEAESLDTPPPLPPKGYAYASSDLNHGVGNAHSTTLPFRSRQGPSNSISKANSGRPNPASVASPKSNSRSDAATNSLGQTYHNNSHHHYHSHRDLEHQTHRYNAVPPSSPPSSFPASESRGKMNAGELLFTRDDLSYLPNHHRDHHRSTSELGHNSHGLRTTHSSSASQQDHHSHYQPHHYQHQQAYGQHYHYQHHNSRAPRELVIVGTASNAPVIDFASSNRSRTHPPEPLRHLSRSPPSNPTSKHSSPNSASATPRPHQRHRRRGSSSETESDNFQTKMKPTINHSRAPATVNSNSNFSTPVAANQSSGLDRQFKAKTVLSVDDGEQPQHLDKLPRVLPDKVTTVGSATSTQPHTYIQPMPVPPKDSSQIISPAPVNHHSVPALGAGGIVGESSHTAAGRTTAATFSEDSPPLPPLPLPETTTTVVCPAPAWSSTATSTSTSSSAPTPTPTPKPVQIPTSAGPLIVSESEAESGSIIATSSSSASSPSESTTESTSSTPFSSSVPAPVPTPEHLQQAETEAQPQSDKLSLLVAPPPPPLRSRSRSSTHNHNLPPLPPQPLQTQKQQTTRFKRPQSAHAAAPPPPRVITVDSTCPPPPRPPRLHSPPVSPSSESASTKAFGRSGRPSTGTLGRSGRGDLEAVKQALQLPSFVTSVLASTPSGDSSDKPVAPSTAAPTGTKRETSPAARERSKRDLGQLSPRMIMAFSELDNMSNLNKELPTPIGEEEGFGFPVGDGGGGVASKVDVHENQKERKDEEIHDEDDEVEDSSEGSIDSGSSCPIPVTISPATTRTTSGTSVGESNTTSASTLLSDSMATSYLTGGLATASTAPLSTAPSISTSAVHRREGAFPPSKIITPTRSTASSHSTSTPTTPARINHFAGTGGQQSSAYKMNLAGGGSSANVSSAVGLVLMEDEEPGTLYDLGRIENAVSSTLLGASLSDVAEEPRLEGANDGAWKASSNKSNDGTLKVVPPCAPHTTVTAPTPTSAPGEMSPSFISAPPRNTSLLQAGASNCGDSDNGDWVNVSREITPPPPDGFVHVDHAHSVQQAGPGQATSSQVKTTFTAQRFERPELEVTTTTPHKRTDSNTSSSTTTPSPPPKSFRTSFTTGLKRLSSLPRTPSSTTSSRSMKRNSSSSTRQSRTPSPPLPALTLSNGRGHGHSQSYSQHTQYSSGGSSGAQTFIQAPPRMSSRQSDEAGVATPRKRPQQPKQKVKALYPPAMFCQEVMTKKTVTERCAGYTQKINELYLYDSGLSDWLLETTFKVLHPNAPPPAQSAHIFTPQPRHTSRSSVLSDASFPRRPDASLATDLTPNASSLDASAPTAPPPLPYPSLALQQLQMQKVFPPRSTSLALGPPGSGLPSQQSSTEVNRYAAAQRSLGVASGASSSAALNASGAVAAATNKAGAFFSSLGRKASLSKKDRVSDMMVQRLGIAIATGGHRVLTKSPPPIQHHSMQVVSVANSKAGGKETGSLSSSSSSGSLNASPNAHSNAGNGPTLSSSPPSMAALNGQSSSHVFPSKNIYSTPGSSKSPASKVTSPSSNPVTPTRPLHITSNPSLPPSPLPTPNGPRAPPPANRVSRSHTILVAPATFKNTHLFSEKGKEVERERGDNNGFLSEREVESSGKDKDFVHKRRPSLIVGSNKNNDHASPNMPPPSKSSTYNSHNSHHPHNTNGIAAPAKMSPGNSTGSDIFSLHVDRLANVIPSADRETLAGYVERAGSDALALGQYLEDEKMGTIRRVNH